jgi:hypothetical protein
MLENFPDHHSLRESKALLARGKHSISSGAAHNFEKNNVDKDPSTNTYYTLTTTTQQFAEHSIAKNPWQEAIAVYNNSSQKQGSNEPHYNTNGVLNPITS